MFRAQRAIDEITGVMGWQPWKIAGRGSMQWNSEDVTWFVLKTPESISQGQADAFGKLYPADARPTQPLYGREVLV